MRLPFTDFTTAFRISFTCRRQSFYFSLLLTTILQVNLGQPASTEAKNDGGGGDSWSYKSCTAPVKSLPQKVFFTGRMPFLTPNQQCQSTEGKISHPMDLLTPNSPGRFNSNGNLSFNKQANKCRFTWKKMAVKM